jgi:hypothetical protein
MLMALVEIRLTLLLFFLLYLVTKWSARRSMSDFRSLRGGNMQGKDVEPV